MILFAKQKVCPAAAGDFYYQMIVCLNFTVVLACLSKLPSTQDLGAFEKESSKIWLVEWL